MPIQNLAAGAVLSVAVGVFAFSDTLRLPEVFNGHDKALHALAFAGLAFVFLSGARRDAMAAAGLVLIAAALALEWSQPLLTLTREASWLDAVASVCGVLIGAGAALAQNAAFAAFSRRRRPAKAR